MSHPRQILDQLGAQPLKRFSQNFLVSPHWITKLGDATIMDPGFESVWEIGPGLGAMTRHLVANTKKPIHLFETDKKLAAFLRTEFPTITMHEGDVLKQDLSARLPTTGKVTVLSNLPYHISSAILFELIAIQDRIHKLVLTFQRELGERLIALPESKAYSALSVIAQLSFQIKSLGILPAGAFYPAPGVDSMACEFLPKPPKPYHGQMIRYTKAAFAQRRKKMLTNLRNAYPAIDWKAILGELNISENSRAENLSVEDFIRLAERVHC